MKPHDEDPHGYCKEHDLFACPFHADSPGPTDAYGVVDVRRASEFKQREDYARALVVPKPPKGWPRPLITGV